MRDIKRLCVVSSVYSSALPSHGATQRNSGTNYSISVRGSSTSMTVQRGTKREIRITGFSVPWLTCE